MKKRRIPQMLAPAHVRSMAEVCALQTDNADTRDGWIILNGPNEVVLKNQKMGEDATGSVTYSRRAFARLAQWFLRPQRTRKNGR